MKSQLIYMKAWDNKERKQKIKETKVRTKKGEIRPKDYRRYHEIVLHSQYCMELKSGQNSSDLGVSFDEPPILEDRDISVGTNSN
jgi:hypothetical protein